MSDDDKFSFGLWKRDVQRRHFERPYHEVAYIIEGEVEVTDDDGEVHVAGPGDILITPKGSTGFWKNLTPVKKVWGIYEEADAEPQRRTSAPARSEPKGGRRAAGARRPGRPRDGGRRQRTRDDEAVDAAAAVAVRHAQRDGAAAAARPREAVRQPERLAGAEAQRLPRRPVPVAHPSLPHVRAGIAERAGPREARTRADPDVSPAGDLGRHVAHVHGQRRGRRLREVARHRDPHLAPPVVRPGVAERERSALALAAGRHRERLIGPAVAVVGRRRPRRAGAVEEPAGVRPAGTLPRRGRRRQADVEDAGQERARVDHLEVAAGHALQRVERVVVPARVRRAAHVPVGAVVGDHHPVLLQSPQDGLHHRREPADVEVGAQPHAQPHRRQVGVGGVAGEVRGRIDVGALRVGHGEAQRVVEHALAHDLVVPREARQDGQTGRVGRGPAVGAQRVRLQVEDGSRAGVPGAVALLVGVVELVEHLGVGVQHEHVPVAVGVGSPRALHRSIRRHGVRARVALVAVVGEVDGDLGLRPRHDDVRDADARALPHRAEVGVQACRRAHAGDVVGRVRIERQGVDRRVPGVVGRQEEERDGGAVAVGRRPRRRRDGEHEQDGRREPAGERGGPCGGLPSDDRSSRAVVRAGAMAGWTSYREYRRTAGPVERSGRVARPRPREPAGA